MIQLDWLLVCRSKGVGWQGLIPIYVVAPYSCIDLLSTLEVLTYFFCSFFFFFLRIPCPSILLIILTDLNIL